MAVSSEEQLSIDSVKRRESCELIKLIRKLRWIGMEQEAEVLEERWSDVLQRTVCSRVPPILTDGEVGFS